MSNAARAASVSVLASLVALATVGAQGTRVQFGLGASLTVPTGNYHSDENGDGFNVGWQGTALVAFKLSRSPVGFRVDGVYGENGANDQLNSELSAAVGAPTTGKTKLLGGNVDVTYDFRPSSGGLQGYVLTARPLSPAGSGGMSGQRLRWPLAVPAISPAARASR